MNKLFENWRRHLQETSDEAFLDELEPLLGKWTELQTGYGAEGENIPPENLPKYTQKAPGYYKGYTHHPSGRRAVFAQTSAEESLEKDLIRLFLKHSDQEYLAGGGMTWVHDLSYRAHAQPAWSSSGLKFAKFSRTQWVKAQGQRQRDVLSAHGFDASHPAPRAGSYGFYVKPTRVLYASKGDLATQTLRTAHADVRSRFANKLPKRAGMDKLKASRPANWMRQYSDWRKWVKNTFRLLPSGDEELWSEIMSAMRTRDPQSPESKAITNKLTNMLQAAGVEGQPPPKLYSDKEMRALRDNTLLNQQDVMSNNGKVEEGLMANWQITGWYMLYAHTRGVFPYADFWRAILPQITVPVYAIDQFANTKEEIPLEELKRILM